ncbi:MAG: hypothetical protein HYV40_00615 [Candidatus Levybacteria bacterium]|nr:hypothetical protein [Candidatus Levybacteria bacterium]
MGETDRGPRFILDADGWTYAHLCFGDGVVGDETTKRSIQDNHDRVLIYDLNGRLLRIEFLGSTIDLSDLPQDKVIPPDKDLATLLSSEKINPLAGASLG